MLARPDCPLSKGMKENLTTMKGVRDEVEHLLLGRCDLKWAPLFQTRCLNFESSLTRMFSARLSLQRAFPLLSEILLRKIRSLRGSRRARHLAPCRGYLSRSRANPADDEIATLADAAGTATSLTGLLNDRGDGFVSDPSECHSCIASCACDLPLRSGHQIKRAPIIIGTATKASESPISTAAHMVVNKDFLRCCFQLAVHCASPFPIT